RPAETVLVAARTFVPSEKTTSGCPFDSATSVLTGCGPPGVRGTVAATSVVQDPLLPVATRTSCPVAVVTVYATHGVPSEPTAIDGAPSGPAAVSAGEILNRRSAENDPPPFDAYHRPVSAAQATCKPPEPSTAIAVPFTFCGVIDLTWGTIAGPNGIETEGICACMATAPRVQIPFFTLASRTPGREGEPMGRGVAT